ncbi:unnamed protein product [Alopecurus aequalis]
MTKPDRSRDGGTEAEREAKKKRHLLPPSSSWEELEADPAMRGPEPDRPAMTAVGDRLYDQGKSVAETACTRVDEMTKAVDAVEEEEEQLSSFTPISPISRPYIPDALNNRIAYPGILAAFKEAYAKYEDKLDRRFHLSTLSHKLKVAPSCLFHHPHLHPIRESAKKAVLHAGKYVIKLSSSVDGKPLGNCCGLWIRWDKESKTGIILTSAHLICSKNHSKNRWEGYNIKANVIVHLLDDTTAQGHYLYHQEYYDLAFFKVRVAGPVQFPSFNESVKCGQDVFRLGRDDDMNLRITHGRVEYWNAESDERHHYMYLSHQENDYLSPEKNDHYLSHTENADCLCDDDGGCVIDLAGDVVGLVNKDINTSFVPSSILNKCLDLWWKFGLLDPVHIDKMWRMYKIEDGLIVEEVSKESDAEKLGIRLGDIIERFNGECISTTIALENMLLGRCKDHFDQGNRLNTKIDVSIQVFHTEERLRRTVNLSVDVSDGGEVIIKRTYPITTEGTSAGVQSSEDVADDPFLLRETFTWEARECT